MARHAVTVAVESYLAAAFPDCPLIGLNTQEEPPEGNGDFIEVQYPVSDSERLAVSDRLYEETGVIRVVICTERGIGKSRALQYADRIADLLRDRDISGVNCKVPDSPALGDFNDDGTYWVCSVLVPYSFQYRDE